MFDIVGDIHGCHEELVALLGRLGYVHARGAFRHSLGERRVLFVGDYIDRGPAIKEVVATVRSMVDAGSAIALMGNHEYNAIAFHTSCEGAWLRSRSNSHLGQHLATLCQFGVASSEWKDALNWMRSLPLFYEDDSLRAVHAAWVPAFIRKIRHNPSPLLSDQFLRRSAARGSTEYQLVENLLKGVEIPLPSGSSILDKDGTQRSRTRVRWWLSPSDRPRVYRDVAMPPYDHLPDDPLPQHVAQLLPGYDNRKPVFIGHYWLTAPHTPLTDRIACLDYSVARGGSLVAYRFDGEEKLTKDRFFSVAAFT